MERAPGSNQKCALIKTQPGGGKAPAGEKVHLFTVPDRMNNRPRGVTSPPLWNGRLHTPCYTLTIKEFRHKFYRPAVDTQNEGINLKSPSLNLQVRNGSTEHLHIQSDSHCKQTRFSSTHFLRVPAFRPSAGTLPASGYSGIHGGARCYIQPASAL